eukprot:CAMPEP_0172554302 /NCGR_PEP_ID=MMETSP1067-20121228/53979_1 /TAXON_ID=265564 ORGANISM="Thalassiosira punctigera, Strain Tpunct2005C2" /NCGR_SAMPLE_ID=MMETSP1067 /ASSEMBLY_ACC=CAM_ASM_000444 /LENGTH=284 /DNA_ID=CAMNT_0013342641 /DNA_START=99 /DNA_END=953 /DNA_ORIENTATION=-
MQLNANEAMLADEKMKHIAQLESEIEARRDEINRLRIDAAGGEVHKDGVDERRDETNELSIQSVSALREESFREDSFGEIIVLWEQEADEQNGVKKILLSPRGKKVPLAKAYRSTDANAPPDMVYTSSFESEEACTDAMLNPPSPRSINTGLFEHLLSPFGSPRKMLESTADSAAAFEKAIEERDLKIKTLEGAISSDTKIMKKMKDTIERLSMELLSAKKTQQMYKALGSRSSSLEDEIEELKVENLKLRVSSQMLEEEKERIEKEMQTELALLQIEREVGRY